MPTPASLLSFQSSINLLCITFSLFLCIGEAQSVYGEDLVDKEKRLFKGEIIVQTYPVKKSSLPKLVAEAIFMKPAKQIWNLIYDCARYSKVMPSIKESKNLGILNNGKVRCQLTVDLPWPLDDLTSVTDTLLIEDHKNGRYQRIWTLVSGDYTINEGSWTLESKCGGSCTYLRYEVRVEPKTSVPGFLKRAAQKSKIPGMFEKLRSQL